MEKIATEIYQPQLFWLKWDVLFPELFSDFMTQHIFWWFFLTPVGFGSRGWAVRGLNHPSLTHIRIGYNHYRCTFPSFRYGASWVCFPTNFNTILEARLMFKWLLKICSPREYHTLTPSHGYPGQKYNENSEVVNVLFLKLVWKQVLSNWHVLAQFSVKNIYIGNQDAQTVVLSLPWMAGEIWSNYCTSLGLSFVSCKGWPWRSYLFPLDFI